MNIALNDISYDSENHPQFLSLKNVFIRGSTIKYVHLNPSDVDTKMLQEQTKVSAKEEK